MKVELHDGYDTMREQRRGGILALAWQLGRKPLQREIADFLDVSRSYAASLLNDPDGSLDRERKTRYAGVCEKCGGPTSGGDGRAKAPKTCRGCVESAPRRMHEARRIWNEQKCLDSIVRWVERHGRIPRTIDLIYAEPGERPCFGTIVRHCYRYEQRTDTYRDWRGEGRTRTWDALTRSLPDILVELAPRLPVAAVLTARNAWVRARLFEVIGVENIIAEAGKRGAVDDYGTLWRIERDDWPEPVVMVQVVNSTPEPDGTFKDYFLRVPPDVETPREAIAWTFAVEADDYELAVQT